MTDEPMKPASGRPSKAGVAAACAAALLICSPLIATFEGKRNTTYRDIVGVVTACYGHTGPELRMGQAFDDTQCRRMLDTDVGAHMAGVVRCTPSLVDRPNALAAATSLTFNIGVRAYCGSTVARRFNAGDIKGGCDAFLSWTRAGSNPRVSGLVKRRAEERRLCLSG